MRSLGVASRTDGTRGEGQAAGGRCICPRSTSRGRSAIWEGTSRRTCARATAEVGAGGAEAPAGAPGATTTGTDSRPLPRPPTRRCRTPSSVKTPRRESSARTALRVPRTPRRRSRPSPTSSGPRSHPRDSLTPSARSDAGLALGEALCAAAAASITASRHGPLSPELARAETDARDIRGGDVRRRVRRPRRPRAMVRNAD